MKAWGNPDTTEQEYRYQLFTWWDNLAGRERTEALFKELLLAGIDSQQEKALMLGELYRKDGDEWESLDYPVTLLTTPCHYGGVRYWFSCPAMGCGKRVALLYLGDRYFACRKCYQLAYHSQRETANDRGFRGASKIRDQLNWQPGIANPNGEKPKNMHWKTYHRLINAHDGYADQAMQGIIKKS